MLFWPLWLILYAQAATLNVAFEGHSDGLSGGCDTDDLATCMELMATANGCNVDITGAARLCREAPVE